MSEKFVVKTAKIQGNKNKTLYAIALVLMLTIAALIASLPATNALTFTRQTTAYLSVAPQLIGAGQQLTVNLWVYPAPEAPHFSSGALNGEVRNFDNITVTFTRPDGTKHTFMPTDGSGGYAAGQSEPMGAIWFFYRPNMVGSWSVQFSFPGKTFDDLPATSDTVTYPAADSEVVTFTVQKDPVNAGLINGYPWAPLPTGYWTRPINSDNREWYEISGDWLPAVNSFNPYSTAPNSAHILWYTQVSMGGLIGGEWGSMSYPTAGGTGGGGGSPSVVIAGKVYINMPGSVFRCYDIRTGELVYEKNGSISRGQHLETPTVQGGASATLQVEAGLVTPYLWEFGSSAWKLYDARTGALLSTISNVPSSTSMVAMSDGDYCLYCMRQMGWNTTKLNRLATNLLIKWNYSKVTGLNWLTGIVWNVSMKQADGTGPGEGGRSSSLVRAGDVGLVRTDAEHQYYGFDLITGAQLYAKLLDYPWMIPGALADEKGHTYAWNSAAMTYDCIDIKTGAIVWTSEVAGIYPWGSNGKPNSIAYNNIYIGSFDGYLRAIDIDTGEINWAFFTENTTETVFGTMPPYRGGAVADGKIYVSTSEHTPTQPRFRFNKMYCLDAYTGKQIWNMSGATAALAIADGYLLASSENTGLAYCFGKGQTATTVTVQNDIIPKGSTIMIKGTVMDQSPAQPGTPAISDEDMTTWMDYLQMQKPLSTTVTGVPVTLTAIDPNGNTQNIDTVTSDASGMFSCLWTPPIEGKYTIIATFNGTESYWSSYAETAIGVSAAPSPSAPPTTAPPPTTPPPTIAPTPTPSPSPTTAPPPGGIPVEQLYLIAAAAVIIVIVAAAAIILKRRK